MYANNGNGRSITAVGLEIKPQSELEDFRVRQQTFKNPRVLDFQRIMWNARQTARRVAPLAKYLAPTVASILLDSIPGSRRNFNSLTIQLLYPLLQKGDRHTRQKEAEFFAIHEAEYEINIAKTGVATEAALMEVLAAEASHTQSESEAAALIGTALPLTFRVMDSKELLRPVLPVLLVATARLVRFLHRHSHDSRRLLRLVPVILRRTIASLLAARRWGCPMTSALVTCVMAIQCQRVLGNSRLLTHFFTRNVLIRFSTVAPARFQRRTQRF